MASPRWALILLSFSILIISALAFEVPILDTGLSELRRSPLASNLDTEIRLFPTNMQRNVGWAFSLYQWYFVLSRQTWRCSDFAPVSFDSTSQGDLAMVIYEWADVRYLGKVTTPVDDEIDLPVSSIPEMARTHTITPNIAEDLHLHFERGDRRVLYT